MAAATRFSLVVEDRYGSLAEEYSFTGGELIVGRSRECDIVLASDNVSRRHARLTLDERGLIVEDLASANGVRVNDSRVEGVAFLKAGDVLRVGDFRLHVRTGPLPGGARSVLFTLRGLGGEVRDRAFEVTERTTLVGRGAECGLVLMDESVSRVHARIVVRPDGTAVVEDLGATNGVFVNDRSVRVWQVSDGDRLRFGDVGFSVSFPAPPDADDLPTARVIELERGRRHTGLAIAAVLAGALVTGGVLGVQHLVRASREAPATPVPTPVPASVAAPSPERAVPHPREALAAAREALEARRLGDAEAQVARVLRDDPASEDAVLLSNRIARERDAQAALEAGLEAIAQERLEPAVAYLVQIPAGSVFEVEARAGLRRALPAIASRERSACGGPSRRTIECIHARALKARVAQALGEDGK